MTLSIRLRISIFAVIVYSLPSCFVCQNSASQSQNATNFNDTNIEFEFWPPAIRAPWFSENGLEWENETTVMLNVSISDELVEKLRTLKFVIQCEDTEICKVEQDNDLLIFDSRSQVTVNLTVRGMFIGKSQLKIEIISPDPANLDLKFELDYPINILRTKKGQKLQDYLIIVVIIFVSVNTFMMGTQLKLRAIMHEIKRPIGPIIGFLCQYVCMPLLGWLWAVSFLQGRPGLQFGFFAISCAPGGGMSNMWTILLEGNLDLSMTMTFFSNVAALGMLPMWLYTVGVNFFEGEQMYLPFMDIAQSLAALIIPSALGMIVVHFKPLWIPRFKRPIKIFSLFIVVFMVSFSSATSWYLFFLIKWYTVIPGILLPLSAYVISYVVSFIITRFHQTARTVAIETGIQNGGVAMLICLTSLPQPDSSMAIVAPLCVMLFTGPPLWIWLLVRTIRKRCCGYIDPELVAIEKANEAKHGKSAADLEAAVVKPVEVPKAKPRVKKLKKVKPATDTKPMPAYLPTTTPKESEL